MSLPLLSLAPVGVPFRDFPKGFLRAWDRAECSLLSIHAREAVVLGIDATCLLTFLVRHGGTGRRSVSVWPCSGTGERGHYLTEQAVRLLRPHPAAAGWILVA